MWAWDTTEFPFTTREWDTFWSHVNGCLAACMLWSGTVNNTGYGSHRWAGKAWNAHRLIYYWTTGELPQQVMHVCDVRRCVNPLHLRAGTAKENSDDMVAKGRDRKKRRLSDQDCNRMCELYRRGFSQKRLAAIYGVSPQHVSRIVRRVTR